PMSSALLVTQTAMALPICFQSPIDISSPSAPISPRIRTSFMESSKVTFPASLYRIISNITNNAIFAMKERGGTLTFKLESASLREQLVVPYVPPIPAGEYVKISVADTGSGMDSSTLERIFAPFFTTKAPGEGLGLGLSSALRLLKEGNAYFTVETTLGKGTTFVLYWPKDNDKKEDSCPQS
ncbi:MAG: hypothetical protein HUK20_00875, partial [Fibrobacter sp.]|nr:hypothetical protein [Fibrobacter sp.]